jgi:hypothetical protein
LLRIAVLRVRTPIFPVPPAKRFQISNCASGPPANARRRSFAPRSFSYVFHSAHHTKATAAQNASPMTAANTKPAPSGRKLLSFIANSQSIYILER